MKFSELSTYLKQLDETSSRLEITRILAEVFSESKLSEIDKTVYLVLGVLAPNYRGIVFNIADKLMLQAIAKAYNCDLEDVIKKYKTKGDLGKVAEELNRNEAPETFSVSDIYQKLLNIAEDEGEGSVERKIEKTALILRQVGPLSSRYLARIPVGKLRLGFSDKTIIDALSWMETGGKKMSKTISEAYNILPDVGLLAKNVKEKGISRACKNVSPVVGIPVLPMLAQRIKSPKDMIEKMGEVFVEPKFDGLRVLIHFQKGSFVKAFTRNSNEVSDMFPEIQKIEQFINAKNAIIDSEAVGMDPEMKRLADFQTTMQRRRIHEVEEASRNIPLRFQVFDILCKDGINLMRKPYSQRREILEKVFKQNKLFVVDEKIKTTDPDVINAQYREKISAGLEGVIVKKVDAKYVAGRTGWRWVKMKQEEKSKGKLSDTVDAVVMGYTVGKGKRTGFGMGQFLVGVVSKNNTIKTLTKIGTGLTDEQFRQFAKKLKKLEVDKMPKEYQIHKNYIPDYWVEPKLVVELAGDNLTKSSTHTSGYALRFPRLVNFRDDKSLEQATTVKEIKNLFELQ